MSVDILMASIYGRKTDPLQKEKKKKKKKTQKKIRDKPRHRKYKGKSSWDLLPDLVLEKIFQHLSIVERYRASLVCWRWYEAFSFPRVWYSFKLHDTLLTRHKFNISYGWQQLLDHLRASHYIQTKGYHTRTLIFPPMENLYNLYEYLYLSFHLNEKQPGLLDNIHTLSFTFSCPTLEKQSNQIFGTGGQILDMFKNVMGSLRNLRHLELRDLLLEGCDGLTLLDDLCMKGCETLHTLVLVNLTRRAHALLHPGAFLNLQKLVMSPQNMSEDLLELIGTSKLRNLYIVQNKYTENGRSLSAKAWRICRQNNHKLRVHLCIEEAQKKEIVWQENAPVKSIIYDSPFIKLSTPMVLTVIELYKRDLEVFAHKNLPRFYMSRSFHERADSSLLLLIRHCPYIHTLVIREKISSATALLLAFTAKNLQFYYVRRNAIMLKADWPMNPEWSPAFYDWLCKSSRSYEAMEKEISQILGHHWQALSDKQFKMIKLDLTTQRYMYS